MAIEPTSEQIQALLSSDIDTEIVMLNLLKFKARSTKEGAAVSGADEYANYGAAALQMVEARGGRVVWSGQPRHVIVGDPGDHDWDMIALVAYPSRDAFIEMTSTDAYGEINETRLAAMENLGLICCEPAPGFEALG